MKRLSSFLLFFIFTISLAAQWDKHPIFTNEFQDTEEPIWLDLNNDGLDDLLGYDEDISTFFWRENNGSKFLNPKALSQGSQSLRNSIYTTGDWDNDGDQDILAHLLSSTDHEIDCLLLLNDGTGNFAESSFSFTSEQYFGEINLFGDFNSDGFADLVVKHSSSYYVYIFSNGTYESLDYKLNTSPSFLSTQLYILDIDGDGKQEVLEIDKNYNINFHEWNNNTLSVTKSIPVPFPGNQIYSISRHIDFVDLDYDGDLDIVRSIQDLNIVIVIDVGNVIPGPTYLYQHLQDDNGNFSTQSVYTSQTMGDGFQYALVNDKLNESYSAIFFDGPNYSEHIFQNGVFSMNSIGNDQIPFNSSGILSSQCLFSPNQENLVTLNMSDFSINAGSRSLIPETHWFWENCINCSPLAIYDGIESTDVDGDGDLDLIVSGYKNKNQLVWIENHLSGCHFENINNILVQYFESTNLKTASADFDNDGDNDLVIKNNINQSELYILKNDGTGNFSSPSFLATIPFGHDLYAEDLFQDGFAEVIVRAGEFSFTSQDPTTYKTTIFNNIDGIENSTTEVFQNTTDGGQIDFADMDNDGDTDMVVYNDNPFNETVVIYKNDGAQLIQSQIHEDFIDMFGMNVFDIDQDSYPDIMAFHDGLSNNNISTLYQYNNNQGTIDFMNPNFIFEDIGRFNHYGMHNPDNSFGFVGKTAFGSKGPLVYYNQNGVRDTLDQLNPEVFFLADINTDGFDDIVVADEKGGLNFYTQGEISCTEDCVPDTKGYMYFDDCNSIEYFLIETLEGEILDPYFVEGVNFEITDGQFVEFSFIDFDVKTPCEDVRTVYIQCIDTLLYEPQFTDYLWLENTIDQSSGCCEIEKIEAYYNLTTRYIYITPRSDCQEFRERLYDENGLILCLEPEEFNSECFDAFGLDEFEKTILYQCDPVANENIFDESLIEVYPNPSSDIFEISTEFKGQLKLLNAQGKCLKIYHTIPQSIDLQMFENGLYFLSFESKDHKASKKVIKL